MWKHVKVAKFGRPADNSPRVARYPSQDQGTLIFPASAAEGRRVNLLQDGDRFGLQFHEAGDRKVSVSGTTARVLLPKDVSARIAFGTHNVTMALEGAIVAFDLTPAMTTEAHKVAAE